LARLTPTTKAFEMPLGEISRPPQNDFYLLAKEHVAATTRNE
jgi:hypothetical protein